MTNLTEPVYNLICPAKTEMLANNPNLSKCIVVIFKNLNIEKYLHNRYIWLEAFVDETSDTCRIFRPYQHIGKNDFSISPVFPDDLPGEIKIKSPEDFNKLIRDGFIIKAYVSTKQYRKDMALYCIKYKKLFGSKGELSDEEIWNDWMNPFPMRETKDSLEAEIEQQLENVVKTHKPSPNPVYPGGQISANTKGTIE